MMVKSFGDRAQGSQRVYRGGTWNNNGRNCRSAYRNANTPDNRNNNLGFRACLAPSPNGISVWRFPVGPFSLPSANPLRQTPSADAVGSLSEIVSKAAEARNYASFGPI